MKQNGACHFVYKQQLKAVIFLFCPRISLIKVANTINIITLIRRQIVMENGETAGKKMMKQEEKQKWKQREKWVKKKL